MSDPHRTTTMLAVENGEGVIAVDCGGDLIQRMLQGGIELGKLEALVLTHGHPDHVSGFPLLMQRLWLQGRREALPVVGPAPTLAIARRLWEAFDLGNEKGMPPIDWIAVGGATGEGQLPFQSWQCRFGPASHGPDTIGLRFQDPQSGSTVAYSSDTAPDPRIAALARDSDILVHEATGSGPGHSSVLEAAGIAKEAKAKRLLLVHLPPRKLIPDEMLAKAETVFPGMEFGEDGRSYHIRALALEH